ncbi:hypothetical protein GRI75_09520 [Altererythrobacter soli]|uniref:Uncharacterized protein n=1 Tax=Croceibacterium soli TaxID=1739690 RepID=A0A6I4UVR6_9SPHN|nr:hypothetical protein [Croceibacterium soli]MXP41879.1 hypothetical protein [Croceibacterium soli]
MSAHSHPDHRIRSLLERFGIDEDPAITPLDDLRREVHQYGKRRCDIEASRDNLKYHLGFAFEANEALNVDSLALTGLLSLPWEAFVACLGDDAPRPERLIDGLSLALLEPEVLEWARAQGVWLQWTRLEAIYREEVEDFRKSDAFHRSGWRRKGITRPQRYLIGEIHRILGVPVPDLANRGQAYEFIAANGGNPRFLVKPPLPAKWWKS